MTDAVSLIRIYHWHAETFARFKQIDDATHLDPSPQYSGAPEMLEWRRAAYFGAAKEARDAAAAYDRELAEVIGGLSGYERAYCVEELMGPLRASTRRLWTLAGMQPPWEANGTADVADASEEVSR